MTLKKRTTTLLMLLLTARADRDSTQTRVAIEALAKEYGLENYPPR